ncbi:MAG: IS701 family transposase [Trebonia sp.]
MGDLWEPGTADKPQVSLDGLQEFCHEVFCSFPRSDQRRWGELYVRGLLTVPGRKTVRKISDLVAGGGAEQCLQQFVNQSTWEWSPVRRDLAERVAGETRPYCWIFKEVVFPKNGDRSAGVAKQFTQSARRLLNCQRAIAAFLASPQGCFPVNWRLILPKTWDTDESRREPARVPDAERCLPTWQHILSMAEEMADDWKLPSAPVIADLRVERHASALACGLEALNLHYVLRVAEDRPATIIGSGRATQRTLSFAEVILSSLRRDPAAMRTWQVPAHRPGMSSFLVTQLPDGPADDPHVPYPRPVLSRRYKKEPGARPVRYVAAEWSSARRSAKSTWLTTLDALRQPSLAELAMLCGQADSDLGDLYASTGLLHFEGRSYPGWHHYVTLVSAARAWSHLCGAPADDMLAAL